MSCQWEQKSHGSWELTQSNPPSELPNDPIISTSSNPDERSSSPVTQSEMSQSIRTKSETQIGDSLFSQAAQQETEPIPRDIGLPNPEDMLLDVPDSPSRASMKSDIDDHIASLRLGQHELMELDPETYEKKPSKTRKQDPGDEDFEIPSDGEQDSDSSYVEETSQHRKKKKAPNKSTVSKTTSKPRRFTKSKAQNTSTVTRQPKQVTARKSQPQKKDTISETAPKRPKPTKKKTSPPGEVIQSSKPGIPVQKQAKRVQPTARVPKRSFYTELEDGESTQATKSTNTQSKPELDAGKPVNMEQDPKCQSRAPVDSSPGIDEEALWYLTGSPEKQDDHALSKIQQKKHVAPNAHSETVGPNSKKKRSPVQSGSKQDIAKKSTTRTYGQKATYRSGDSEYFQGRKGHEAQRHGVSKIAETRSSTCQSIESSYEDMDFIPDSIVDNLAHAEGGNDRITKHEPPLPSILEEPDLEAAIADQASEPSINITSEYPAEHVSPGPAEANTNTTIRAKQVCLPAPIPNMDNKQLEETEPQPLSIPGSRGGLGKPSQKRVVQSDISGGSFGSNQPGNIPSDNPRSSVKETRGRTEVTKEGRSRPSARLVVHIHSSPPAPCLDSGQQTPDGRKDLSVYANPTHQPHDNSISTEHRTYTKEDGDNPQRHATPIRADTRSRVTDLGSPLMSPKIMAADVSTRGFQRDPLESASRGERFKPSTILQEVFKNGLSLPSQMTSDYEPQLMQANIPPLATRATPQTGTLDPIRPGVLDQPLSRAVLSPSSSIKRPANRMENSGFQAPQLHPKAIDFARKVAQDHKMNYNQIGDETHGRSKDAKQPLWEQSKSATGQWDSPRSPPPEADISRDTYGRRSSRGHQHRLDNQAPKPDYEAKWQDAVDAASGGVIDTLHFISTSLLEHLRSRDESVVAVVEEYKRNGTKISERLAKCQTYEWHEASATAGQKCMELAAMYERLSRKTQDFRTKCLSKHRSQAYAEWQQQATRIRSAVRTAREEATLG